MKNTISIAVVFLVLNVVLAPVAHAEKNSERKGILNQIKQERQDLREKTRELRKDFKTSEGAKLKERKAKAGHITGGSITSISSPSFVISKDGVSYVINTSAQTKFRRHFWGKSSFSELSVGDKVNVWGKWTDESQKTLDAKMVRNLSVMKRFGAFIGQITSIGSSSFVMHTVNRGDQTVLYDANTKFVNRREQTIAASDLKVGDRVRAKGLWDKVNKKITQVTQVKDFSLPKKEAKLTITPGVTYTVTPTPIQSGPTVAATSTPTP